ncbi:MAG: hypothetical protein A2Y62_14670 [Candidatus Fischerbacteria bacterium RBG_13_37_8]|uniref:Methyltransferase n=1 Tax=Candidatus Fischerbacteria bacterium RBG_13_37_8 TaxID=1817863 RepID=A0A1F5VNU0_9BACT|nr:MAG: hypothetical protein A2Y62_14670 [Candidatus Fischerbacteria bacterium RBG_13_37_8]
MPKIIKTKEYGITLPQIDEYMKSLIKKRSQTLTRMEGEALREGIPIIGPMVAPLLTLITSMIKAKSVLELGTAIGYSTIYFALAVKKTDGLVMTMEKNEKFAQRAYDNIQEAQLHDYVTIIRGDIMKKLPGLKGNYDLIFIDSDKEIYPDLIEPCVQRLRTGGILLADNVLWDGLVVEKGVDSIADIMREFNEKLYANPALQTVILPIRDGLAVSQKK